MNELLLSVISQHCHQNITPLLSKSLQLRVSSALKPSFYGSEVTLGLNQVTAPLGLRSCPLPSGQEPEHALLVLLGDSLGARGWELNLPGGIT